MLRSCKGNVKLAWPFLETIPDLFPVVVTRSPSTPLGKHARSYASTSSSQAAASGSGSAAGAAVRATTPVPARGRQRSTVGSNPGSIPGERRRSSDHRSRRSELGLTHAPQSHQGRRMSHGLAPRPAGRSGCTIQTGTDAVETGARRYGSVALAIKEEQEIVIGADHSSRTISEEGSVRNRPADTSMAVASSMTAKPGSNSSRRPRSKTRMTDLEDMLDDWRPVRAAKSRNKRIARQDPAFSLQKEPYNQVRRFLGLIIELHPEVHKQPELRPRVVRRLQTLAQSVIDRNLQGARAALGLPSSEVPRTAAHAIEDGIKDWKLSSRMVQFLMEGLMTYGLFDLAEAVIYLFETNNKRNKIDLEGCLHLMMGAERWEEVSKYASGRRRGSERKEHEAGEHPVKRIELMGMEMKALNELRRFDEALKLYEASGSDITTEQGRYEVTVLCEAMRASLSLRRVMQAMKIRDKLWQSRWYEVDPAAYVTALSEGIRASGSVGEIEERVLAEEMQILHGHHRRRLLDAFAKARVDAGSRVVHILPFYGFGPDELQSTLNSLTADSRTIEWMMGSNEITPTADALKGLWDRHLKEKNKTGEILPSYVLVAFVKACVGMREVDLALRTVKDILQDNASTDTPHFHLHAAVFTPLIQEVAKNHGIKGAETVLRMLRPAHVDADDKMARTMIHALIRHYDITDPEHEASLVGMVEALCADQSAKRRRKHFTEGLNATDRGLLMDKQVLRELLEGRTTAPTSTADEIAIDSPLGQYREFLWNNDRISLMRPKDFYHAMTQYGVTIDGQRFTEVMTTYLEISDAKSAWEAFNTARMVGIRPGYSMWITLLWGLMRFEGLTRCRKTLNALRDEGLEPNIAAYTTVGAALIRSGRYRQSKEFMDLAMKRLDPAVIDTKFISVAFNAYCRAGLQTDAIGLLRRYTTQETAHVSIDRKLRESIKRFRAWHGKRDDADARALAASFNELVTSEVAEGATASMRSYIDLRAWLLYAIRKYWLDLPAIRPVQVVASVSDPKAETGPDATELEKGRLPELEQASSGPPG